MASIKIASLFLKTLAKPLANKLKSQAKEHEGFRNATIAMAQFMHRNEMNMRIKLLGEAPEAHHIRPLNDKKAIDSGANFISESFLFGIAAFLILAEGWRSRRKEGQRRDLVAETLDAHDAKLKELSEELERERKEREAGVGRERELEKVVDEVVKIGVRGGWLESPSSGWESHVRLSDAARESGRLPITVVRNFDEDEGEGAVLRELARIEGAGWEEAPVGPDAVVSAPSTSGEGKPDES